MPWRFAIAAISGRGSRLADDVVPSVGTTQNGFLPAAKSA